MNKSYDVIVIGGGVAGYYSAKTLKQGGKSVALVEKNALGGTALISGALPVKKILDSFKNNKSNKEVIKESLLDHWDKDLEELNKKIEKDLIQLGIHIYYGNGEFLDAASYKINEDILNAKYFIIATGTEAASISNFEIDNKNIITHKEAIHMKDLPQKITILGGNVEGVEFAAVYALMGVEVVLIEMQENILYENDWDLVEPIENHLKSLGVQIITGVRAIDSIIEEKGIRIILDNGQNIYSDKALTTFLRKPNFPQGIANTKIKIDQDKILVDKNLQTHEKNIFAIGDINGILGMGHMAIRQGLAVANDILKGEKMDLDQNILPRAVFTIPEMAGVGCQEWELINANTPHRVGIASFQETWRGWANKSEGFVKIILDKDDVLLGVWMVGENVSEYIGLLGMVIKEKRTAGDLISNLIIHPSLTEAIFEAVIQAKEKVIQ